MKAFIKRMCNRPAILWRCTGDDGYGKKTFLPEQVYVRWEKNTVRSTNNEGEQTTYSDKIFVLQEVKEGDYITPGLLDELQSADTAYTNGVEIRTVRELPGTVKTETYWEAYPWQRKR